MGKESRSRRFGICPEAGKSGSSKDSSGICAVYRIVKVKSWWTKGRRTAFVKVSERTRQLMCVY
jgi:hypothetical protein